MGRGLSKLQEQILAYLQTYAPPYPKSSPVPLYGKVVREVAHITGGEIGDEDYGTTLDPAFSVSFTRAVDRLEARGMVERVQWPDPHYAKRLNYCLSLTQAGRDWKPGQKAPAPRKHRKVMVKKWRKSAVY